MIFSINKVLSCALLAGSGIQSSFASTAETNLRGSQRALKNNHGCLASAGYSYCETTDSCLRFDEECPTDDHGCTGSTGQTYCPETKKCINLHENCPIKGKHISGSKELTCTNGRLSDLTTECSITEKQSNGSSLTLSGPYLWDMNGVYVLPEGCSAKVTGCRTQNLLGRKLKKDHGCLASAGYSYCKTTNSCLRFDEDCPTDDDQHGCTASTGQTYCPETKKCINLHENCPIKHAKKIHGSMQLTCHNGRLSNLTKECTITHTQDDGSPLTLSGPYLWDMNGVYVLPEGCSAKVKGCQTQSLIGSF